MTAYKTVALLLIALLTGCAGPARTATQNVSSTLMHGADSVRPLSDQQLVLASACLSDTVPLFWGRYFNHSDLPERGNRMSYSFRPTEELPKFKKSHIKLLPIFAQNINNLSEMQGRVHGVVNASDLIRTAGAKAIVSHLNERPLLVVLNEETPDQEVLSEAYYKGWIEGFMGTMLALKANATNVRPIVYGNITSDPKLREIIQRLYANRNSVPYYGFWLARTDPTLQRMLNAEKCGRLDDWNRNNTDWDEEKSGPLLARQYVLQAQGANGSSVDLNALNPKYAQDLLNGMLSLED